MWECIGEERSGIKVPIPYVFRNSGVDQVSDKKGQNEVKIQDVFLVRVHVDLNCYIEEMLILLFCI